MHLIRFLIFLSFFLSSHFLEAQSKRNFLVFEGTITVLGKKCDNRVSATLITNGRREYLQFDPVLGEYQVRLGFNKEYTLLFSADDYVSQQVSFKTFASKQRIRQGFPEYELNIDLKKQINKRPFTIKHSVYFRGEVNNFDLEEGYVASTSRQMKEYKANLKTDKRDNKLLDQLEEEIKKEEQEEFEKDSLKKEKAENPPKDSVSAEKKVSPKIDSLTKTKQPAPTSDIKNPSSEKKLQEKSAKDDLEKAKNKKVITSEQEKIRLENELKAKQEAEKKQKKDQEAKDAAEKIRLEAEKKALEEQKKKDRQKAIEEENKVKNNQYKQEHLDASIPLEKRVKSKIEQVKKDYPLQEKDVVLKVYKAVKEGYSLKYYGFINFGDGKGNLEITKDEFNEFSKYFKATED